MTFNHPYLPAGWITTGEYLKNLIADGHVKVSNGCDGEKSLSSEDAISLLDYLGDNAHFINSLYGTGENDGCFLWVYTREKGKITMANRIVQVYLHTDF